MDIGYIGAFLGGLLSLLSPCSVMLLPAFFAYAFTSPATLLSRTGLFTLGLIVTLIPLGVFSGLFGSLLGEHRGALITGVAVAVIVVGSLQLLGVPIPGLSRKEGAGVDRTSALSVFLLGTVYAVAGVCTGPILGSVLMVASLGGSPAYGAVLLTIYALGMVTPLVILTILWRRVGTRAMRWMRPRAVTIGRWQNTWTMIITGTLSIGLGVLLIVSDGTANLGGIVDIGTQYELESQVGIVSATIPDWWFAIFAALTLAGVATVVLVRSTRGRPAHGPDAKAGQPDEQPAGMVHHAD